ncbi:hypothetical protein ACX93W_15145 [Paenibacillus sp. CAU 1782]
MKLFSRQNWGLKFVAGGAILALLATSGCSMTGTTIKDEKSGNTGQSRNAISKNDAAGVKGSENNASGTDTVDAVVPAESPVIEAAALLDQLQAIVKEADSAASILDFISGHIQDADHKTADAMLRELQTYYGHNLEETRTRYHEKLPYWGMEHYQLQWPVDEEAAAGIPDEDARAFILQLSMDGYKLGLAGGTYQPLIDYSHQQQFGGWLSDGMNQYIEIKWKEAEKPYAKDGGLLIAWDELAERALRAESFLQRYSDTPEVSSVRELFDMYVNTYLGNANTPNTPLYDQATLKLNAEVKKSYGKTMKDFPDSVTAKLISGLLEILASTKEQLMVKDESGVNVPMPAVKTFYDSIPSETSRLLPTS